MGTRERIVEFLNDVKMAVACGFVQWLPRVEDRQHLIDLGITERQALDLITSLTPGNYSKGSEPDHTKPDRDVWVFGCDAGDQEAYIKLALQPDNRKKHRVYVLIWSFHVADFRITYPLRGDTE